LIFYKLRRKIVKSISKFFQQPKFVKGYNKVDLLIYDDIFPHPISGFRYEEFKVLLCEFESARVFSEPLSYPLVNSDPSIHKTHIEEFRAKYPELKNKIVVKKTDININTKLFYCVFLNNIYSNLYSLEKFKIPFVFTLYPGGGFEVENEISNQKLNKVLSSPQLKKVIVTQLFTKNYLLKNKLCSEDKIEYVFGGVVPQISLEREVTSKKYYPEKETFDIVFCAAKYMPMGIDKGYDLFIELAIRLSKVFPFLRFHVIGGFDKNDIDVSLLGDKVKFYGYQKFDDLASIFSNIDIILSPNKPFILGKGAFDGFPLGTVIEAVFNGVVPLVTDNLNQNTEFEDGNEIIIINNEIDFIEKKIIDLIKEPDKLLSISRKSKAKFLEVYSNNYQLAPRINLLKEIIEKN
jgi:glycosyltransferase involved in cell wall biosynthesis